MNDLDNLDIRDADGGAVIAVKVVAGSSRDRLVGVLGQCLKITTSAAPQKGKANAAVAGTLAEALGVDKRSVRLLAGRSAARKEFQVAGLTGCQIRTILSGSFS